MSLSVVPLQVLQAAASSPKQVVAKRHAIAQLASIRNPTTTILDPLEGGRKSPTRGSMSHLSISFRRSGDGKQTSCHCVLLTGQGCSLGIATMERSLMICVMCHVVM